MAVVVTLEATEICTWGPKSGHDQWRFSVVTRGNRPPKSCPAPPPNFFQATGWINWF